MRNIFTKVIVNKKKEIPMNKKIKLKKIEKIIIFLIFIYFIVSFVNQQKILNAYKKDTETLAAKKEEASTYKENLIATKENINSEEFIEQMAREKLNMYMPNEKVYIDIGN